MQFCFMLLIQSKLLNSFASFVSHNKETWIENGKSSTWHSLLLQGIKNRVLYCLDTILLLLLKGPLLIISIFYSFRFLCLSLSLALFLSPPLSLSLTHTINFSLYFISLFSSRTYKHTLYLSHSLLTLFSHKHTTYLLNLFFLFLTHKHMSPPPHTQVTQLILSICFFSPSHIAHINICISPSYTNTTYLLNLFFLFSFLFFLSLIHTHTLKISYFSFFYLLSSSLSPRRTCFFRNLIS